MLGRGHVRRRRTILLVPLLTIAALVVVIGASSTSASAPRIPPPGTFAIGTTGASVQVDPALAYITTAWEFEYMTCAKLVNYPDTPWGEQDPTRLRPEIAVSMPTISQDRRTYTFRIRDDFAFSPPWPGVVTAQSMKYTYERTLSPQLASPAHQFFTNIVGEVAFHNGQANEITGIVAQGDTLTFQLIEPQADFVTLLAMPFGCAIPIGLPRVEQLGPVPSAGPYYISGNDINVLTTISRNPNYDGPRPQRFNTVEYHWNLNEETAYQQVLSGDLDWGPIPAIHVQEVADLYGPDSPAAARGLQQFYVEPQNCVGYLPLNNERPLFGGPNGLNMRKAVNYALDRTAYSAVAGPYAGTPFDQLMSPGTPGYEDIDVYPAHPDVERARDLAGWHPGDPRRPITVYYRSSGTINPAQYQIVRQNLMDIGFDVTGVGFSGGNIYTAIGTRGEPFDLAVSTGWCSDYNDPWQFIKLYDGTTIHDGPGNINFSYFNDPVFNDRMHAAAELYDDERYDAFKQIEHDLVRNAAPAAPMRLYNNRYLFSRRMGCHHYLTVYGIDLAQLCLRPEITTGDASVLEPSSGMITVDVPVRLSSEMDNAVTVSYATQNGTAQAGSDYTAATGTVTFAPRERLRTVSVQVSADNVNEPSETFFLTLSNESSGTMIDGQAVVTILNRPVAPPPPIPPPPPIDPPPPAPPVRCVVPRVIGMTLRRAKSRIRAKRCGVGRVRYARSRRAGKVIGQTPRPGTRKPRGFKVKLLVGRR